VIALDAASGLTVVRTSTPGAASLPAPWTPRHLEQPHYFVSTDVSQQGVSLRPVFIGSLDPVHSPLWSDPVWVVPPRTDLARGSFLFTTNAELVGLVISDGERLAVIPGGSVLAEAERLVATPPGPVGSLGIEVQDLTPSIASVTGAREGVVVSWVDPDGTARDQLTAGAVIEAIDDRPLESRQHWEVRIARLSVGEALKLRVRHGGEARDVALVANAPAAQPTDASLGLTLRGRTKIGVEVVRVERGSGADRAGLAAGDVITQIGDLAAPTPSQVRSYIASAQGKRVIVAVTRGDAHFVTTLPR
jgi:S1-C subfamily serine protease